VRQRLIKVSNAQICHATASGSDAWENNFVGRRNHGWIRRDLRSMTKMRQRPLHRGKIAGLIIDDRNTHGTRSLGQQTQSQVGKASEDHQD
jgi:hypothetical protein